MRVSELVMTEDVESGDRAYIGGETTCLADGTVMSSSVKALMMT